MERSQRRPHHDRAVVWLAIGVASPVFLVGTRADFLSRSLQFALALAFGAVGLVLWILEARRDVADPEARVDRRLTLAYASLMVVVASAAVAVDPVGPPAWFIVASLLPSVPCALGVWRALRRTGPLPDGAR